ncbi:AAA family ATPase [Acidovorax sp. SUPP1855]|uniref:AAA family ATPase n=1 Tax=Acidovorax sp. SUPP1855 TaxID=431774 RepID=UPI0023DE60D5|nr:AAA family ATPase [Acidovorax sp. SUPP1855]GKS83621.1 AAA family ATPase [Acidovorax sp. SUPP1855]
MQHIERETEPTPEVLRGSAATLQRETLARFMADTDEKRSQSKIYRSELNFEHPSLKIALARLFHGRCAFCEAERETTPYHFRPPEEALPYERSEQAHLYYSWLALAWQNFYAICSSCRPRETNYFPVLGKRAEIPRPALFEQFAGNNNGLWPATDYPPREKPLLLDPCTDRNFHTHLWVGKDGALWGLTRRGTFTIEHFQLNSWELAEERRCRHTRYFEELREQLSSPYGDMPSHVFDFQKLEFGGTWYLLLRRLAASLGAKRGTRPVLAISRIESVFRALKGTRDAYDRLTRCWSELSEEGPPNPTDTPESWHRPSKATISEISIENFKAIEGIHIKLQDPEDVRSVRDTPRSPSALILGENAAGKSSILEAIALTLATPAARNALGLTARNFVLSPYLLGAPDSPAINYAKVTIRLSDDSTRTLRIQHERMVDQAPGIPDIVPVFAYGAFRQYQHRQSRKSSPAAFIRNLFDASVLPNPERWLLELSKERFAMVVRALRDILSIEGEFEVIDRDLEGKQCFVVTATTVEGLPLVKSPLNVASSGFRSVLAMACDVMRGLMNPKVHKDFDSLDAATGVVLIDEVEAHLHPRWKMRIMRGLRRALPNVTFIATTHDPLCLRGMNDGEVVVLRRATLEHGLTGAGLSMRVEAQTQLPSISELRVEQLLTSDLFQLHSTDDPQMESQLAHIADLLAMAPNELTDEQRKAVDEFNRDIASAMPIGTSEAQRIVQEAVAEYLQQRSSIPKEQGARLRERVKARIVQALQGVL